MAHDPPPAWIGPAAAGAVRLAAEAGRDVDDILEHAEAASPARLADQIVRLEQSAEPAEVAADLAGLLWADCEDVPPIATILQDPASQAALEAVGEARRQAARRLAATAPPAPIWPLAGLDFAAGAAFAPPAAERAPWSGPTSWPTSVAAADPAPWLAGPALDRDLDLIPSVAASPSLDPTLPHAPGTEGAEVLPDEPALVATPSLDPRLEASAVVHPTPLVGSRSSVAPPRSPGAVPAPSPEAPPARVEPPRLAAAAATPPASSLAAGPRLRTISAAGRRSVTGAAVAVTAAAILVFGRRLRRA